MKPLLVLVDLQQDFLNAPCLEPHRDAIVGEVVVLLQAARARQIPVLHIHTAVRYHPDERMLHWRLANRWMCVEGTAGHATPAPLAPIPGEVVLTKTGFGVGSKALVSALNELGVTGPAVIAGVHAHACVRQAALDLIEGAREVWIAREAVGSHEPWHAAHCEIYLRRRSVRFASSSEILARFGAARSCDDDLVTLAASKQAANTDVSMDNAVQRLCAPRKTLEARAHVLHATAGIVGARAEELATTIVREVGKPLRYARNEVARTVALLQAIAYRGLTTPLAERHAEAIVRRRPLGNVAIITPWNNPLAIAAGQIAPALLYGNAVLWKPSPAAQKTASSLQEILIEGGLEAETMQLVLGDNEKGLALISHECVDAVCFTGSTSTGRVVAAICSERNLPLQAELGGNNGVIVTSKTDLERAARLIVEAAFGCAGQRCTATRRVIVSGEIYEDFLKLLCLESAKLEWGRPESRSTIVGPLRTISEAERVSACVERAKASGCEVIQPHLAYQSRPGGAYYPPTLVLCDEPQAEIVQEETFGPVLVVQRAHTWPDALTLLNGVRHGLVAALFSNDDGRRQEFLEVARAGVLKLDQATVEAGVDVPFCGWKMSGVGPPQHGDGNREFFTRAQAVYDTMQASHL